MDAVGDAGVHAVPGVRHPEVGGVTGDEDVAVAEPLGDEASADPVLVVHDLVGDGRRSAEQVAWIDRSKSTSSKSRLPGTRAVEQPQLVAVDRDDVAAHPVVDDPAHPGRTAPSPKSVADPRAAHERGAGAADLGVADQLDAHRLADGAAAAVAADEVPAVSTDLGAVAATGEVVTPSPVCS